MAITWTLNGTDLSTHKIYIVGTSGSWRSTAPSGRAVSAMPGRLKAYLSRIDDVGARTITLPFRLTAFSVTDRQTEEDWIKQFYRQSVTIGFNDTVTSRQIVGTVSNIELTPVVTPNSTVLDGVLTLQCAESTWRATSDTVLGSLGNSDTAISLGTAPVEDWSLAITVSGGSDARTITVTIKNGSGTTLHTLAWTGTIGANTLTISAALSSVKNNTTDTTSAYTGGFPVIDPKDSPTIRVVSSSGTATGVLTHRKRYY
jgi:hypothetical protein